MSLSVNCMTRGPADRVAAMLGLFRGIADEIVIAVDDRAGPDVEAALASVADRMLRYPYAEPVDRPLAWIHAQCSCDWVLTIDDDEIPSQALLDLLPELANARDVTHYWLPRRWLYPTPDRYLDARPWRPDYQPRLVLKDPRVLSFTPETHVPVKAIGPSRYLEQPLYHLDTVLNSRESRAAKAVRYERLHPGKRVAGRPLNEAFYLPEDRDPPTAVVPPEDLALIADVLGAAEPEPVTPHVEAGRREEIDRWWSGGPLADYAARLSLVEEVPPLRTGASETVDVRVENLGSATVALGGRHPARFSLARRRHGRRGRASAAAGGRPARAGARSSRCRSCRRCRAAGRSKSTSSTNRCAGSTSRSGSRPRLRRGGWPPCSTQAPRKASSRYSRRSGPRRCRLF